MVHLTRPSRSWIPALLLATVVACDSESVLGPPTTGGLHPAVIEREDGTLAAVTIPTGVVAGEEFTVSIETFGNSALWATDKGEVRSTVSPGRVLLEPFDDFTQGPVLGSVWRTFSHEVRLILDEPGEHEVRIVGRKEPSYREVSRSFTVRVREGP